jgi:hypothetical protein
MILGDAYSEDELILLVGGREQLLIRMGPTGALLVFYEILENVSRHIIVTAEIRHLLIRSIIKDDIERFLNENAVQRVKENECKKGF